MSFANALKKAVSKTFKVLGGNITIRRTVLGGYNVQTGTTVEKFTDTTIKGVVSNVSSNEVNDLIEAQDKRLTISAGDIDFLPTTKDKVIIEGIEYSIIQILTNEQGNIPISFELILR